ncbi:MAG: DUF4287 domain-containing protein [Acidobacteriota bacterium]
MAKSPEEMQQAMIANLSEKTGRPLDEWIGLVRGTGLDKHGKIVAWLKGEHGMTHGYANLVSHLARAGDRPAAAPVDLVEAQYGGRKADLRPIYDDLAAAVEGFGSDVELSPKKTYVSLRRSKQFGLIQPSTATRVDVGIQLAGDQPTERLEASGSFNGMVSHRVRVTARDQVDEQLIGWLREAYERA